MHAKPGFSEGGSLTTRYWRSALLASRSCALCSRDLCSAHLSLRACAYGTWSECMFSALSTVHGIMCPVGESQIDRLHGNEVLHVYGHG